MFAPLNQVKGLVNTIVVCEPGVLVNLESFNKYMLTFFMKLKRTEIEQTCLNILSGCGP